MRRFARGVIRYAASVTAVGTLLAAVGAFYSVKLYQNLRPDLEELLPTTSRSVKDLEAVTGRLEAIENMVLLVRSEDVQASRRYVDDLASLLKRYPKNVIYSVEHKLTDEIRFFNQRKSLFLELRDLVAIRDFIIERIRYEKALYNPLTIFRGEELPEPKLDFKAIQGKYESRASAFGRFPGGYYATPDEKLRAIVVYAPGKGIDGALKLKNAVTESVAKLDRSKYALDLKVQYTGNLQNVIEETAALMEDLELSTAIVVILCALVMLLYYRSLAGTVALNLSLFMGTFWTFGATWFTVGYLNANTAFLASIVIGNGINFGIIFLARYVEERRKGRENTRAIYVAMLKTWTSTVTAALAAGLAYGSLMLTRFRGFNQFGVIGLIGMILCWLSAYTVLPALLVLWNRVFPIRIRPQKAPRWYSPPNLIAHLVDRFPAALSLVSIGLVVGSFLLFPRLQQPLIETNLDLLRDKKCMTEGSGKLYKHIGEVFGQSVSPTVILPTDRKNTREIASRLREVDREAGASSWISSIQSLDDFIPAQQEEKVRVLKQIKGLLPPQILDRLPLAERKLAAELLDPRALNPFKEKDLPPLVLQKFREKDGSIGKIVLLDKKFAGAKGDRIEDIESFVRVARDTADSVEPGTPVAGGLAITYDMIRAIIEDGPRATLFAFLAVFFLVVILFRKASTVALCVFGLLIGMVWMAGYILLMGLKINFLNFIALPITFGIGVDYGVNVFQRYREEGDKNILEVIRSTGGAVMLASSTTIIGYGSLLIAGNQAFVSFGHLAVAGEMTCLIAAVVSLPALLRLRARRKERTVHVEASQIQPVS